MSTVYLFYMNLDDFVGLLIIAQKSKIKPGDTDAIKEFAQTFSVDKKHVRTCV